VRAAGTGHSFTPLCATDEVLISLEGLQGVVSVDPQAMTATVWAGTRLSRLTELLFAEGIALENQGDIDLQSVAGAISTGTHGTGRGIGSISTQVEGMRLVLASGDILDVSEESNPKTLKAARVSLGALGVISQVTLRVLPSYRLHGLTWLEPFEECMEKLEKRIASNRHFEFFWSPAEDTCVLKTLNPTQEERLTGPPAMPEVDGFALGHLVIPEQIDWSHRVFPSKRDVKFNEIEYALSAERGPGCIREIRELMQTRHRHVSWPVEYRTLGADDNYLSPAYGRETVTISVHQAAELSYQRFFDDVEEIFREHEGRPHWGKIHSCTTAELRQLYPMWDRFQAVREQLDPARRFMNDYLWRILEKKGDG